MARMEVDDAWHKCEADIVLEFETGRPGKAVTHNIHQQIKVLVETVILGIEALSDRLHDLCKWRFRIRGEVLLTDETNILRILVVDSGQQVIDEVAKVHITADAQIKFFPVGDPDGSYVAEGQFREAFTLAMIGEKGVIKELVLWRLHRIREEQQQADRLRKADGREVAVGFDATGFHAPVIIPKTW